MFLFSIFVALGAALSFALAAVFQQEAARGADPGASLTPRLLLILLHRPKWLAGVGLLLCGYGLQALALSAGPVAVVQPVVATELAFAIPLGIWRGHRRAGRREWTGIAAVLVGVSALLWIASPVSGSAQPSRLDWLLCLVPVGTVIAALLTVSLRIKGPRRAVLLGAAAGLAFSLLAILTKAVTHNLSVSVGSTFANWEIYLLVGLGIAALVISQSAYQAGPLALSMPAIALLEPTVAVIIGDTAFHEQARLSGGALAVELIAAAVAASGLLALASSPTVLAIYEQGTDPTDRTAQSRSRHHRGLSTSGSSPP
ncbi:MAG TPA: DMT family transporter [Acidimicrobiales bacterium]|nr:DMT family transporter [Acidimicrobiales bacterium]